MGSQPRGGDGHQGESNPATTNGMNDGLWMMIPPNNHKDDHVHTGIMNDDHGKHDGW